MIKTSLSVGLMAVLLMTGTALGKPAALAQTKAELMGRVEHFFMNNFRDVTSRQSLEWGEVETDAKGASSIRYMYNATIWDKKTMVMNQVFTFNKNGTFVGYKNVEGFPKKKQRKVREPATHKGMIELVEDFFRHNFRDITKRETIQWSQPTKDQKGHWSIRYKYRATIRGKDKKVMDQVFTFDAVGTFISVQNVEEGHKKRGVNGSETNPTKLSGTD